MFVPQKAKNQKDDAGAVEKQPLRIETLSVEQQRSFVCNHLLISALENGASTKTALEIVARHYPEVANRTIRWAQKLYARFKNEGFAALLDRRLENKNQNAVLTAAVQRIVLSWWYARPAAGAREIWRAAAKQCRAEKLPEPTYITVYKFLDGQSEANKMVRAGKIKTWDKEGKPVVRFNLTNYSNQRWQLDHTRLDVWIREWFKNRWVVCEAWLTVAMDAHSRSIAGFVVSLKNPDAWTTSILLRKAILPKQNENWANRGKPAVLQPDRGKDFMSCAVQTSVAAAGILFDPDPPYYPNRKGKIERFFLTLDHHLRILPGHHKAIGKSEGAAQKHLSVLLTREQLQTEIEHWIVSDYHRRENSETKRAPAELWEETVRIRMPESEQELDAFLLKNDKVRTVRNTGIDFHIPGKGLMRGGRYWAPELAWFYRREITVSHNPEDLASILVYCAATREYICEAWLMDGKHSKYAIADVKKARGQARRGLLERQKMYSVEIEKHDRRVVKRENWRRARENQASQVGNIGKPMQANESAVQSDGQNQQGGERISKVQALLDKFNNKDRGK